MALTCALWLAVGAALLWGPGAAGERPFLRSVEAVGRDERAGGTSLILRYWGRGLRAGMRLKATPQPAAPGSPCPASEDLPLVEEGVWAGSALFSLRLPPGWPADTPLYTCLQTPPASRTTLPAEVIKWVHLGDSGRIPLYSRSVLRERRSEDRGTKFYGMRLEGSTSPWSIRVEDAVPELRVGSDTSLRIYGEGMDNGTLFALTTVPGKQGELCEFPLVQQVVVGGVEDNWALVHVIVPALNPGIAYFFCFKGGKRGPEQWKHAGSDPQLSFVSYDKLFPVWVSIVIILVCLLFSSLFSGLNLGLMSLDRTDLKIIASTGSEKEKMYAKAITPVREHGNYLLCSILLGNVMVNSTFTILLDDLTSGLVAVLASTIAIVIFGEITPQAICSRHGLAVGAKTIGVTKLVMAVTFPLSYPISKLLDCILGEEIGAVYTRERLKELVKLTTEYNDLQKDEINIISGALELSQKIVREVMTKLEDVFMLAYDSVLDFECVTEIMKSGYSRVPVYEGSRSNIVTLLYTKDLALIDPDDNMTLKTVCQFYQNACFVVFEDTKLDVLFKQFKEGSKGHMALVHRVNNEGEGDPFYETVGIITLEDVIEELIQSEIMDETDVWTDNRSKHRRHQKDRKDFTAFAERNENQKIHISPQLTLATYQFLSTSVDPFKPENISETILRRLLKQDVFFHIRIKNKTKKDTTTIIYNQAKPVDYFVLILEGRVEVTVGRENLIFESGPFTFFGCQALTLGVGIAESPSNNTSQMGSLQSVNLDAKLRSTFVPDYGVRAITEVFYMKIKRSLYLAAMRATLMERSRKEESTMGDTFEEEVDKLMHLEDTRSQGSPDVTRTHSQQASGRGSPSPLNNGNLLTSSEPMLLSTSCLPPPETGIEETHQLLDT